MPSIHYLFPQQHSHFLEQSILHRFKVGAELATFLLLKTLSGHYSDRYPDQRAAGVFLKPKKHPDESGFEGRTNIFIILAFNLCLPNQQSLRKGFTDGNVYLQVPVQHICLHLNKKSLIF